MTTEQYQTGYEEGYQEGWNAAVDKGKALSPATAAGAALSRELHPEKCPITARPFFMTLDHPELGVVPTYGGPYDSYTIPAPEGEPTDPWHERDLRSERYDHDAGWWVEGGEHIPLRIVHEDVLFKLQADAEATAMAAPGVPKSVESLSNKELAERLRCGSWTGGVSDDVLKKAARYDFLRDCDLDYMAEMYWPGGQVPTGDELDAAIDAARARLENT